MRGNERNRHRRAIVDIARGKILELNEKTGEFGYQDPQVFSKIARARGLVRLLNTSGGRLLCLAGVALDVAGVLWIRAVLRRAERA